MTSNIVALAYIGKFNEPLFFYCEEDNNEYLNLQMIISSSLDVVEEKRKKAISTNSTAAFDMYLGKIYSFDDYDIYGISGNTHIKTIIVCRDTTSESLVKEIFTLANSMYIAAAKNPFQPTGLSIISKQFKIHIKQLFLKFNRMNN